MFVYNNSISFNFCGSKFILSDFRLQELTKAYPRHSHSENSFEIHYFPSGNGKMIVENKEYLISPKTIIITGPFINHEQIPTPILTKYSIYLTIFKEKENNLISSFLNVLQWGGIDKNNCGEIFNKIKLELELKKIGYIEKVECYLKELIISIIRNYNISFSKEKENVENDLLFKIEAIFLNEFKTITISDMANRLYMSVRQLQRFLNKYYKKNFNQLKIEARMNYSLSLLKDTNYSIKEIAINCGYSTTEHFSQAFKKSFKITPLKYRKQNKNL